MMKIQICILATLVASTVSAQTLFTFGSPKGGNIISPDFSAIEANRFTVGATSMNLNKLGHEADFLATGPRQVAVWDFVTGAVIAQTSVSASDPLTSGYRYRSISTVVLLSGRSYVIGALHGTGFNGRYLHNTSTATLPSGLIDNGTIYAVASTIDSNPFWENSPPRHYVANAMMTPVPEPGTLCAIGLGLVALIRRRNRRK